MTELLAAARQRSDALFALLAGEKALWLRPLPQRHRFLFYLGHLEAFDYLLCNVRSLGESPRQPELDHLFERGIDPPPGELPQDQPRDWPAPPRVRDYVAHVRELVDGAADRTPPDTLRMAIEHRLMHVETLAYMLHAADPSAKRVPAARLLGGAEPVRQRMVEVPAGMAVLGQPDGEVFGWDNEFSAHRVEVPAFRISRYKVSNGEYLEFVNAGQAAPHYWVDRGGKWHWRGMFGESPLDPGAPVWVTLSEARSYAAWRGLDLPTEAQFHRAAEGAPLSGNLDFASPDPLPLGLATAESRHGVVEPWGNGWEWTRTPFAPFAGFQARPAYPGYSADFFDDSHFVLKGASPWTARELVRPSFRNWFRPDYPYVFAGFRVVENHV